jgi:hypothetical protein
MDRRNFLKGVLGGAVIAALPKPVMEALVTHYPESVGIGEEFDEVWQTSGNVNSKYPSITTILFIYTGDTLIGTSTNFNIEQKQEYIPIPHSVEELVEYEEYMPALKGWWIAAENVQWLNNYDPKTLFMNNIQMSCIAVDEKSNLKWIGEVLLTELSVGTPFEESVTYQARFEGLGELTMVLQKG